MREKVELQDEVELQPQAAPVDTYQRPAKSELWDIAESLGKVDRSLGGFLAERTARQEQDDRLKGEAAAQASNGLGYAEAVRTGAIPAYASKGFVDGFKETEGSVAGFDLQRQYAEAYAAWPGKASEDPNALAHFQSEFFRAAIKTDDPRVLKGLLPYVEAIRKKGLTDYVRDRSEAAYSGSVTSSVAESVKVLEAGQAQGVAKPEGTDFPAAFARIVDLRAKKIAEGVKAEDIDSALMKMVATKATTGDGDRKLLGFFDQKVPGKAYTYGQTPEGVQLRKEAESSLDVLERRSLSEGYTRQEREDKRAYENAASTIIDILAKDPSADVPAELTAAAKSHDPLILTRVTEWRKAMRESPTDEEDKRTLYSDLMNGDGMPAVRAAIQRGQLRSASDIAAAVTFSKGLEDNRDRLSAVYQGENFKTLIGSIKDRTRFYDPSEPTSPVTGMTNDGLAATYDLRRLVAEYVIRNPQADPMQIDETVARLGKTILDRLSSAEYGRSATYSRDQKLEGQFPNPMAGPPRSQIGGVELSDLDWFATLPEAARASINAAAKAKGVPLEDFIKTGRAAYESGSKGR